MKIYHPVLAGLLAFIAMLGTASDAALGQDGPNLRPTCGTARDPVLIVGEGFGETAAVKFDGVDSHVLKRSDTRILCIVPGATSLGEVSVTVDGDAADEKFTVLEEGSPVVLRMSARTVTPGLEVVLVGRRLGGGKAEFVDPVQGVVGTANLWGGHRVAALAVPGTLAPGKYTLRITNAGGLDTGGCSPEIEVVTGGTPTLAAVSPAGRFRGQRVECRGSNLSPSGLCLVDWTDSSGNVLKSFGLSNGYDTVVSHVPLLAEHGATYEVVVDLRGDPRTGAVEYEVGTPDDPAINRLEPDEGPAWSLFRVHGENFTVFGEWPAVEMSRAGETLKAKVIGSHPGCWGRDDVLLALVPPNAADGVYDITVRVGGRTSNAETFTVGARELTVDSMFPRAQGPKGPWAPVGLRGTGFGTFQDPDVEVTWDNGSGAPPREGKVMFRSDVLLVVLPPGGWKDPLPNGSYTVRITVDPDGQARTVTAGTYTVW
jgi:hypothetical protein